MLITSSWSRNQKQRVCNENWWVPILQSQKSTKQVLNCVNKLRSPILVLDFPRSGESSGGGLAPHHWHFSTPSSLWPGCELQKYLLWSAGRLNYSVFKERSFIENLRNLRLPKNCPSTYEHRKRPQNSLKKKFVEKFLENIVEVAVWLNNIDPWGDRWRTELATMAVPKVESGLEKMPYTW